MRAIFAIIKVKQNKHKHIGHPESKYSMSKLHVSAT